MNYFSRADIRVAELAPTLLGPYELHQLVWKLFPSVSERDFLYRWEAENKRLYIVSETEPTSCRGVEVQSKRYEPQLVNGTRLHFSLRASPTVNRKQPDGSRHRCDVIMDLKRSPEGEGLSEAELITKAGITWLQSQGERRGFKVEPNQVIAAGYRQVDFRRRKNRIQYSLVDYDGHLEITDPVAFGETLMNGLGRQKAFGCGLVMVRRA